MSGQVVRKVSLVLGGTAIVAMGALTAGCGSSTKESPTTTPTTTPASSSAPTLSPTEKGTLTPGGPNSFTPSINPAPPGAVCKRLEGGVCIR